MTKNGENNLGKPNANNGETNLANKTSEKQRLGEQPANQNPTNVNANNHNDIDCDKNVATREMPFVFQQRFL